MQHIKSISSGTTYTFGMGNLLLPLTIQLNSTDGGRKIELSCDGTNFFEPTYDVNVAGYLTVVINAPYYQVKCTGALNDNIYIIDSNRQENLYV